MERQTNIHTHIHTWGQFRVNNSPQTNVSDQCEETSRPGETISNIYVHYRVNKSMSMWVIALQWISREQNFSLLICSDRKKEILITIIAGSDQDVITHAHTSQLHAHTQRQSIDVKCHHSTINAFSWFVRKVLKTWGTYKSSGCYWIQNHLAQTVLTAVPLCHWIHPFFRCNIFFYCNCTVSVTESLAENEYICVVFLTSNREEI